MNATTEQTIEVDVPIATAYNQWTQFEDFPRFMEGVEEVRQLDDRRLHWVAEFGGERHEWDAEIVEQMDFVPEGLKEKLGDVLGVPDRRVKGDLERFKEFIESRGRETGAWRGEVPREG